MFRRLVPLIAFGWASLGALTAAAQLPFSLSGASDPATLHVGPGWNTACATGSCPIYGTEVNAFGGGQLDIYQNSSGAPALASPSLLILGVPNTKPQLSQAVADSAKAEWFPSATAGPGVSLGLLSVAPTVDGLSSYAAAKTGLYGVMTSNEDVYSLLKLPGNSSNSFANWSAAESKLFPDVAKPTGFDVYVFGLPTTAASPFEGNTFVNVNFGSALPEGTFAVAFGTAKSGSKTTAYTTPFTQAGVDVPEPGSLALLLSGIAGLFAARQRRRHRN